MTIFASQNDVIFFQILVWPIFVDMTCKMIWCNKSKNCFITALSVTPFFNSFETHSEERFCYFEISFLRQCLFVSFLLFRFKLVQFVFNNPFSGRWIYPNSLSFIFYRFNPLHIALNSEKVENDKVEFWK